MSTRPPWTVHRTLQYSSGYEYKEPNTRTSFRWLLAPPEWQVFTKGMRDPIALKFKGTLRFDLLVVEIFAVLVVAAGFFCAVTARSK
jgi:hypothetical protein